ncbi:hypothetical protein QN277_000380 [Acacia crassicarpa]|uniref:Cytochrome P450 n=1 Tax=Acacia crassicarpa TaxID=499986 RepID=A0AAE1TH35_9FABA|nr:hypothetical protein QN277_000380 [Acacia crassicarpa]
MLPSTVVIPAFLLLTFIYILSIFLRSNNKSKNARKSAPGPLALPVIGNLYLLGTHPHRKLQSLANKYGPIMSLWLGQVPAIVVSSPEAAELFFKTHDPTFASRPTNQATDHLFYGSQGVAFSEYGSYWRNMKKLCGKHLFSPSKSELFGPLRKEMVQTMVKSLEIAASMGEVVNLRDKVNGLLEDMVCKMIFGRTKDDQFDIKGLISQAFRLGGAFNLADLVPCLAPFDLQGLTRRIKETAKGLDQMLEKIIKEHEQANKKNGKQEDFIDMLLSLLAHQDTDGEQEYRIGRDNIKAIAVEIIFGAYETVSITIEWVLSELLRNPKVMKNLQDEIQKVVGINRMVEETDLVYLNYLDMVIKESLRLYPSGPFVPRESVEDVMVNGYYIQKKSRILINAWAIGRDPKIWSDNVHEFYPERFLNNDVDFQGNNFLLVAFGAGRRKCPGLQMAIALAELVVAQLVHCFNWNLPNGMSPCDLDMSETFGWTIPRSKPLLAMPTLRPHCKAHN